MNESVGLQVEYSFTDSIFFSNKPKRNLDLSLASNSQMKQTCF